MTEWLDWRQFKVEPPKEEITGVWSLSEQGGEDETAPTRDKPPDIMKLKGIAPNATGHLSSEEFIAKLRGM
jgi:hypothetical protein